MNLVQTTGAKIKLIREKRAIKQSNLARDLSISVQTLSAIENGKCDITLGKLEQISKLLEVSIIEVIGNDVYKDPLEERKKVFEDATIKILQLYDAFCKQHYSRSELLENGTTIMELQYKIIAMLEANANRSQNAAIADAFSVGDTKRKP